MFILLGSSFPLYQESLGKRQGLAEEIAEHVYNF